MKVALRFAFLVILVLAIPGSPSVGKEMAGNIIMYTEGHSPWGGAVVAYDPVSPQSDPMYFDLMPQENEPGEINENAELMRATIEIFDNLQFSIGDDEILPEDHWRFSILYEAGEMESNGLRIFQIDFFDYCDYVRLCIKDSIDEKGSILFESPVTISRKDIDAFEAIYVERVAKLRKYPVFQ